VNEPLHRTYTVVLEADEESGAFTVTVPLLPGCITEGADRQEALAMAAEAIGLVLEHMAAENEPLPAEVRPPELATLTVARTRAIASAMA
jgi:predicted RNase H-like HicB family nuclease